MSRAPTSTRARSVRSCRATASLAASARDEKLIFATAWEPYQELFQGVARCLHSDFRLGGLQPGETKRIRGKIYVVPPDVSALEKRYRKDFPEHNRTAPP